MKAHTNCTKSCLGFTTVYWVCFLNLLVDNDLTPEAERAGDQCGCLSYSFRYGLRWLSRTDLALANSLLGANTTLRPNRSSSAMCRRWLTGCRTCPSSPRSASSCSSPSGPAPSRGWSLPSCSRRGPAQPPCLLRCSSIG